jgi:hypothetical protein
MIKTYKVFEDLIGLELKLAQKVAHGAMATIFTTIP